MSELLPASQRSHPAGKRRLLGALTRAVVLGWMITTGIAAPSLAAQLITEETWEAEPAVEPAAPATPEEIQEHGRNAVSRGWFPIPWYDAEQDDLRRLTVRAPRNWEWEWPDGWSMPDWWSGSFLGGITMRTVAWAFVVMIFLALALILIRWLLRRESGVETIDSAAARSAAKSHRERIEALPFNLDTGIKDFLAEAKRLYEKGDYSAAIVYLFSHELVELDRLQFIRLTKGKTNRQYLRELSSHRPLKDTVQRTMLLFEASFFGGHSIGRSQFESCWHHLDDFRRLTGGSTP